MRICQVMAGDEEGGLENHFVALGNALASGGDEVAVVAHGRYRERFQARVCFHSLDLARGRRNPLLRRALRRVLERCAPDLVHAHAGKAAALVSACRPRCATVGTVHAVKRDLSAYRGFRAVIGVSAGVLEALDHPRKRVIFNGVPPAPKPLSKAAVCARFGIDAAQSVTLAVGRLVPVKGFERLIALWDDTLGHLLVLGDGPQRQPLRRLAAGKPVTLAGFQADARAIMGAADLLVFASEREGFSYALAEALRARLPVVSTPVPGAADVLPAEHIAPPARLKATLAFCLADLAATRQRLRGVFDWAEQTLTVERMAAETRRVYEEALCADTSC